VRALESDVVIVLASDESVADAVRDGETTHEIRYDRETLTLAAQCGQYLVVVNKRDSVSEACLDTLVSQFQKDVLGRIPGLSSASRPLLISCNEAMSTRNSIFSPPPSTSTGRNDSLKDAGGITSLADTLVASFASMTSLPKDMQDLHGVTERQRQLLAQCRAYLHEYLHSVGGGTAVADDGSTDEAVEDDIDITMAAEQLRYAANHLGRITGRGEAGDVEEILGVIFEK